eukprot:9498463-Alexandrium_andersonii.AAC.1
MSGGESGPGALDVAQRRGAARRARAAADAQGANEDWHEAPAQQPRPRPRPRPRATGVTLQVRYAARQGRPSTGQPPGAVDTEGR